MPDGQDMTTLQHTAQRGRAPGGFPRGGVPRGRVPRGRFPRQRFPRGRFPRVVPIRRRFPGVVVPPIFFGFPRERCYYIDGFGRCCDRFGRCCDRFGRCEYVYPPFVSEVSMADSWYGVPGGWDMMPDYDDMVDYDDMYEFDDE